MMRTIVMVVAMVIFLCGRSRDGPVSLVSAEPLGTPNLRNCTPSGHECCLRSSTPSPFIKSNFSTPRIRPALQTVLQNATYLAKLNAAYAELRRLERDAPNDPRGLGHQRRLHCAFCSNPSLYGNKYKVHGSWFFLPWHRMLLYYHERILASVINDTSFALPFWNWDNDTHKAFPAPYANTNSALYAAGRNAARDILAGLQRNIPADRFFDTFADVTDLDQLMGTASSNGNFETTGHNGVHSFVGGDMNDLARAAYDPVFYAHHANVDRMWSVWRQLRGRGDPKSPDFLNSSFVFYDENRIARIINVSDVLDHRTNLRYVYADVPNSWTTSRIPASRTVARNDVPGGPPLRVPQTFRAPATVSAEDPNVATAFMQSPDTTPRRGAIPELTLRNVAHKGEEPLALYVFINQPNAGANTQRAGNPRYLGARFLVAGGMSMPVSFTYPIRICLEVLNLSLSRNFTVQVVRGEEVGLRRPALSIQSIDYVHEPQA
ncbi:hypothetical protein CBR_g21315 [Chara braunii]|uniref:Tyrosinase copper-binding domain-containing protein n=1 Tax=Chara braunii TaxID=69332 RepID=A0A388L198_CHABU|nr:hypothetical protein CBR_g21315 [Chara braunii]|eukprot:GBG76075.1 hypothetical protein CBR_g21315 [Chara braunii]